MAMKCAAFEWAVNCVWEVTFRFLAADDVLDLDLALSFAADVKHLKQPRFYLNLKSCSTYCRSRTSNCLAT